MIRTPLSLLLEAQPTYLGPPPLCQSPDTTLLNTPRNLVPNTVFHSQMNLWDPSFLQTQTLKPSSIPDGGWGRLWGGVLSPDSPLCSHPQPCILMNNTQQLRVQLEKMFEAMGGKEVRWDQAG